MAKRLNKDFEYAYSFISIAAMLQLKEEEVKQAFRSGIKKIKMPNNYKYFKPYFSNQDLFEYEGLEKYDQTEF